MTRNLSLIPTIEADTEAEPPAASTASSFAGVSGVPMIALAERRRESPERASRGRASPRSRSARSRWREVASAALMAAGIAVLYLWIGR